MARLYADEHLPKEVIEGLRRFGHDVLTVRQTNQSKFGDSMSDAEVLAFATEKKRAVLTQNRKDFERLHQANPGHAGIITCKVEVDCKGQAKRIDSAIKERLRKNRHLTGQLVFVPPAKPRKRRKKRK